MLCGVLGVFNCISWATSLELWVQNICIFLDQFLVCHTNSFINPRLADVELILDYADSLLAHHSILDEGLVFHSRLALAQESVAKNLEYSLGTPLPQFLCRD